MEMLINPKVASERYELSKPAVITITPKIISFNRVAADKLCLNNGVMFTLHLKDKALSYKEVLKEGFKVNMPENSNLISASARGVTDILKEIFGEAKSYRFTIHGFKEGMWHLTRLN